MVRVIGPSWVRFTRRLVKPDTSGGGGGEGEGLLVSQVPSAQASKEQQDGLPSIPTGEHPGFLPNITN